MGSYPYSNIRQPRRKTTLLQKVSQLLGLTRFHSYSDPYKLGYMPDFEDSNLFHPQQLATVVWSCKPSSSRG